MADGRGRIRARRSRIRARRQSAGQHPGERVAGGCGDAHPAEIAGRHVAGDVDGVKMVGLAGHLARHPPRPLEEHADLLPHHRLLRSLLLPVDQRLEALEAVVLLGLGLEIFSMNPSSVPMMKEVIKSLRYRDCRRIASQALQKKTAQEIEEFVIESVAMRFPEGLVKQSV